MKVTNIVDNFEVYLAVLTYWKLVLNIMHRSGPLGDIIMKLFILGFLLIFLVFMKHVFCSNCFNGLSNYISKLCVMTVLLKKKILDPACLFCSADCGMF